VPLTRRQRLYENSQRNRRVALNSFLYGWPVDRRKHAALELVVQKFINEAANELGALLEELKPLLAHTKEDHRFFDAFNPNSGPQLGTLLYNYLEEPVKYRTKQGAPGTGKDALEHIVRHGQPHAQRLAKILKKHKVNSKLQEAYIDGLRGIDLVRPSPHVTAQLSGRWSYTDPALTTTPAFIKPMFVAHPGSWMVACDLAGAEYRSMALQAGCKSMLDAYYRDADLHWMTAEVLFGAPRTQLDKNKHRKIAKGVGLGFHYSVLDTEAAAAGLYARVGHLVPGLTFEMMLGALQRLEADRPEITAFKKATWKQAVESDYVEEPLLNRRRYFYDKPKDTEAFNFAQQAMIAAIVDQAIQGIDAEFVEGEGLHLQRHDELIVGGPDPVRLCELMWKHMRQTHTVGQHSLVFEIEMELTRRWGESVAVVPAKGGTEFRVECGGRGCGHGSTHATLQEAVRDAAAHYDACEKMEGIDQ
jgi:DNA polymerase I-like protein with 3'-5' exonuclease and polymerase domains